MFSTRTDYKTPYVGDSWCVDGYSMYRDTNDSMRVVYAKRYSETDKGLYDVPYESLPTVNSSYIIKDAELLYWGVYTDMYQEWAVVGDDYYVAYDEDSNETVTWTSDDGDLDDLIDYLDDEGGFDSQIEGNMNLILSIVGVGIIMFGGGYGIRDGDFMVFLISLLIGVGLIMVLIA